MKVCFLATILTLCMVFTFCAADTGQLALLCYSVLPLWARVAWLLAVWGGVLSLNILLVGWLLNCADCEE